MLPGRLNFDDVYRGDGYGPLSVKWLSEAGEPMDLTGADILAEIRTEPSRTGTLRTSWDVVVDDPESGEFFIGLTGTKTGTLTPGTYFYDVQITRPEEEPRTILRGRIKVTDDVSVPS